MEPEEYIPSAKETELFIESPVWQYIQKTIGEKIIIASAVVTTANPRTQPDEILEAQYLLAFAEEFLSIPSDIINNFEERGESDGDS